MLWLATFFENSVFHLERNCNILGANRTFWGILGMSQNRGFLFPENYYPGFGDMDVRGRYNTKIKN